MSDTDFRNFHFKSDDGLTLHGRDYGQKTGHPYPIVCLPGLTRNSRDFHQLASRLAGEGYRVVSLDYRGRGLSDRDPNPGNYNIVREAMDVIQALDEFEIAKAAFIGTSRGGLILHVLGGMIGERIAAMIFNDIGPAIEPEGLRRIADYLSRKPNLADWEAAALHLEHVHGKEFPSLTARDWQEMADAIYRQIDGKIIADYDPALAEPLQTMDFSKPLPDLWKQFESLSAIPLLIVRSENSRLLSEATVAEMLVRHTKAATIIAAGQGHAPILHKDDLYEPIARFLAA